MDLLQCWGIWPLGGCWTERRMPPQRRTHEQIPPTWGLSPAHPAPWPATCRTSPPQPPAAPVDTASHSNGLVQDCSNSSAGSLNKVALFQTMTWCSIGNKHKSEATTAYFIELATYYIYIYKSYGLNVFMSTGWPQVQKRLAKTGQ